MIKQDAVRSLRRHCKGADFVTANQLAEWLGYEKADSVRQYLAGLDRIQKRYFIPEVVDKVMEAIES